MIHPRSVILLMIGLGLCLLAVRRLRRYRLKERHALLFLVMGLPFVVLAFVPHGIYWIAKLLDIDPAAVMVLGVAIFLVLMVFELLTIVSEQDQKITTLAQMVGILTEKLQRGERSTPSTSSTDQQTASSYHGLPARPSDADRRQS